MIKDKNIRDQATDNEEERQCQLLYSRISAEIEDMGNVKQCPKG